MLTNRPRHIHTRTKKVLLVVTFFRQNHLSYNSISLQQGYTSSETNFLHLNSHSGYCSPPHLHLSVSFNCVNNYIVSIDKTFTISPICSQVILDLAHISHGTKNYDICEPGDCVFRLMVKWFSVQAYASNHFQFGRRFFYKVNLMKSSFEMSTRTDCCLISSHNKYKWSTVFQFLHLL